jgi:hypothetical protein
MVKATRRWTMLQEFVRLALQPPVPQCKQQTKTTTKIRSFADFEIQLTMTTTKAMPLTTGVPLRGSVDTIPPKVKRGYKKTWLPELHLAIGHWKEIIISARRV